MGKRTGRRRGAPSANQNARSHGLYARVLDQAQRVALDLALAQSPTDLEGEIALLRAKLVAALEKEIELPALLEALRTLTRMTAVQHRLGGRETDQLADAIMTVLGTLGQRADDYATGLLEALAEPEPEGEGG